MCTLFFWMCWDECNTDFIEWVKQCSFPFSFVEILRSVGICSSLKVWWNSAKTPSGPGLFFIGRLFIAGSISLHVIDLFRWLISSWFSFEGYLEICPFLQDFPVYWNIGSQSSHWGFPGFSRCLLLSPFFVSDFLIWVFPSSF
jgi:hypothetical protein